MLMLEWRSAAGAAGGNVAVVAVGPADPDVKTEQ